MQPEIIWYGERGIIDSFVSHIRGTAVTSIARFLHAICWAGGTAPQWIESIDCVNVIVEIDLAEFGVPDLIVVCRTGGTATYVVFIEAKATTYKFSAHSNTPAPGLILTGMQGRGYNSSINGQLALKYRFATALQCWRAEDSAIVEPQGIYREYLDRLNDDPDKAPGRRLVKAENVELLRSLGLAGLPEENVYYVALTWDRAEKVFFRNQDVAADYLPRFYNHDGRDLFDDMRDRIGWIGYSELENAVGLLTCDEYIAARDLMLPGSAPTDADYRVRQGKNLEGHSAAIRTLTGKLAAMLPREALEAQTDSYSVKDEHNRTAAKIMPTETRTFIGVRFCEGKAARSYENPGGWGLSMPLESKWAGVGRHRNRFDGIYVHSEADLEAANQLVDAFLQRFRPALRLGAESDTSDSDED